MHTRKDKRRVIISVFIAILMFFSQLCFSNAVYGATEYPFDQTNVLDDLESSEEFNIINYPWDYTGLYKNPAVINFVEWCYSPFTTGDFALYVYFYNPRNLKIDEDSFSNRIQMACSYDSYPITSESTPNDYDTYKLLFCSKSERANYEGLFYKFRVIDKKGTDGKYIADRVYSGERRYDVSGLTLAQTDGTEEEYTVGGTYFFTGYASGYGPNANADSTLKCTGFRAMETITLDVHHTNYRSESSSLGKYHENEVTSVYFSVPDYYFNKYGNLQKIKAEWYEYKTEPIFIVNNDRYKDLEPFIGVNIGEHSDSVPYSYYKNVNTYTLTGYTSSTYDWSYNIAQYTSLGSSTNCIEICDTMYWLFSADDRTVTAEQMEDYVKGYTKTYNNGKLSVKNGTISEDLFLDTVDEGRTRGYNCKDFDANDDKFNLLSYDETHSGWDKFWDYFFNWSNAPSDSSMKGVSPIEYKSIGNYINMTDSNVADLLLVNEKDVADLRKFYNEAEANDETTVLFRFAETDYYQEGLFETALISKKGAVADVAQTSVFLDFKIIQLTFMNEAEEYKVIPVSQNPIDVYNGLSPTEKESSVLGWFEQLLRSIGAWGVFVISIVVGIIVIIVAVKILRAAMQTNLFFKILLILIVIGAGVLIGVYAVPWVVRLIASLGGLF